MPKIIPIKELRDTTAISEACHNTEEPIFITKNGYGDMVIMSLETFEKNSGMSDFYSDIKFRKGKTSDRIKE
ncbi:MAG: type II toxin-antitoxin system Phd/YefM family antitoxin [Lachnospiraceae bacterium]